MATVIGLRALTAPTTLGSRGRFADILETSTGSVDAAPDGDLQGATAAQALLARVRRMFRNPAGAYAHLGDWGKAIAVKGLAREAAIATYQIQARATLEADPDIRSATVTLSRVGGRNIWKLDVAIVDRLGNAGSFDTPLAGG